MSTKLPHQTKTTGNEQVSLLDLLDRLLYKGVVVRGDVTISVADVDLVYLRLDLLLTSMAKMLDMAEENAARREVMR